MEKLKNTITFLTKNWLKVIKTNRNIKILVFEFIYLSKAGPSAYENKKKWLLLLICRFKFLKGSSKYILKLY